jgi:hypothetical protein
VRREVDVVSVEAPRVEDLRIAASPARPEGEREEEEGQEPPAHGFLPIHITMHGVPRGAHAVRAPAHPMHPTLHATPKAVHGSP